MSSEQFETDDSATTATAAEPADDTEFLSAGERAQQALARWRQQRRAKRIERNRGRAEAVLTDEGPPPPRPGWRERLGQVRVPHLGHLHHPSGEDVVGALVRVSGVRERAVAGDTASQAVAHPRIDAWAKTLFAVSAALALLAPMVARAADARGAFAALAVVMVLALLAAAVLCSSVLDARLRADDGVAGAAIVSPLARFRAARRFLIVALLLTPAFAVRAATRPREADAQAALRELRAQGLDVRVVGCTPPACTAVPAGTLQQTSAGSIVPAPAAKPRVVKPPAAKAPVRKAQSPQHGRPHRRSTR